MTEREQKVVDLFLEGKTIKEISEITERTYDQTKKVKYRFKHLIPDELFLKKKIVNETFFDTIDSEIKAYLLGFFLADGCIDGSKHRNGEFTNRLLVNNSIDDLSVINLFNSFICPESIIEFKNSQRGVVHRKEQASIRWSSQYMTRILLDKYKFCRLKAYNPEFSMPINLIPDNLQRHFVRGYFDGDGNVDFAIIQTTNNMETTRFCFSMVCNSHKFAEQVGNIICNAMTDTTSTIREHKGKTTNWWTLRFNTEKINTLAKNYNLYKWLYEDSNFYLERKKNKFDSFFEYRAKANGNTFSPV